MSDVDKTTLVDADLDRMLLEMGASEVKRCKLKDGKVYLCVSTFLREYRIPMVN